LCVGLTKQCCGGVHQSDLLNAVINQQQSSAVMDLVLQLLASIAAGTTALVQVLASLHV